MKTQRISIIIRTKNNAKTILRALDSVANQSLPQEMLELILVDDGSVDETVHLIKESSPHLSIFHTPSIGAVKALNTALAEVDTTFYTILDADDELPQSALELLLKGFKNAANLAAVYGDYLEISADNKEQKLVSTTSNIFNTIAGGILFKLENVKECDYYDPTLFFPEYDLLIKLMKSYPVAHIPVEVYHYFRHGDSLTANKQKVIEGINQINEKYGTKYPIREY